ncbi:NAD(P)H-dependent oxidoreductase [Allorhizobium sp. BGMRC 0089]|uniref:NAD(P)H-dependent oxidoreductase n=1 Tax=Allorhizobium sonneratiae TaxID=2934936 RepID=UPI002033AB32|nr:NAD(P)H-dependent oxidoreductase [Allorhizobium sonneratiae]MCM2292316.1 NAD(P)H-dependent oxidoreductase [Allorhizobium sonneratiae]
MSHLDFLGLSGSTSLPSRTRSLVEEAVSRAVALYGGRSKVVDLSQFGPGFAAARTVADLSGGARDIVEQMTQAKALIIAAPVYKGSYPGLFKHLFDLLEPEALREKPVLLAATGGGEKHALMIEQHLRPLFSFFEAQSLATAIYVSERDMCDGEIITEAVHDRLDRAVRQFSPFFKQVQHDVVVAADFRRRREALSLSVSSL